MIGSPPLSAGREPERRLEDVGLSRGFDAVSALETQWRALHREALTADFDHFHSVIESEPSMREPAVLTIHRAGALESMVLGRIEDAALTLKLGYRTVYRPSVRSLTIVYQGFLGRFDDEVAGRVVDELTSLLGRDGIEAVIIRRLGVEHPMYRAATTRPRFLVRQHYTRIGTCWERSLPPSFDAFMASLSKSTRTGVKRYANRLERDFAGHLELRKLSSPSDLDVYFRDADSIASRSYQRGLGVGVRDDPAQRRRAQVAAQHGWFRAYVLYVEGRPVAFCGGEAYGGRFYYGIPGYDPSLREHRVGQYVLMKMIEDLCEDEGVHVLDFGPGDAEYKRRFGDRSWHEADVHLFAPRPRPIAVNLARTAILQTNDALAWAAKSLRVFGRIKQGWRRRAAPPA